MNKKSTRFLMRYAMKSKPATLSECRVIDRLAKMYGEDTDAYNKEAMRIHALNGSAAIIE